MWSLTHTVPNVSAFDMRSARPTSVVQTLAGRHERADLGRLVGRVADGESRDGRAEAADQVVEHPGPGDDPAGCGAVLTGVVVGVLGQRGHDRLEVGVVEHDDRRLPAQLEVDAL